MSNGLSTVLRPYLHTNAKSIHTNAYLRFYQAFSQACYHTTTTNDSLWTSLTYQRRLKLLKGRRPANEDPTSFPSVLYPRITEPISPRASIAGFKRRWNNLEKGSSAVQTDRYTLEGKIKTVRKHGKLFFIDLVHGDEKVQIMVNTGIMVKNGTHSASELQNVYDSMHPGDYYSFSGYPCKTRQGELSLHADQLPISLSPSLHTLPEQVTDEGTIARFPQLDLVLNQKRRDLLRLRHVIESTISKFLDRQKFTKITTPILAADTGGAIARPFETRATEFANTPLRLRIAQELALKKLVAADMGPVYELGPVFRNEGLDSTHNPEFTTCEFYLPFANLDKLMRMTEDLFSEINEARDHAVGERLSSLEPLELPFRHGVQFKRLPFLPSLIDQIHSIAPRFRFPPAFTEDSAEEILPLFVQLDIPVPSNPTTSRLLDALSSHFLESLCVEPTFITEHPSIMSPLSKSYLDAETGHMVAARAELFINGTEYVNMYEEENDPFSQARKFFHQSHGEAADRDAYGHPLNAEDIKKMLTPGQQYFIRVLEMGLPPTGGWGGGIDRLVMLFGGAKRIGDVLPFGNLRNVIAMGTAVGRER